METRIETDSMGALEVPRHALYGAQTQRAINNFPVSGRSMPESFIRALLLAKAAAARANAKLELLPAPLCEAIAEAADELRDSGDLMQHFPVDVFQTGSGTSSNMNANEVLATLASAKLGQTVSPNDHVNFGQSSNDTIPSSIHISAAIALETQLLPALTHLTRTILQKSEEVDKYVKTGRTHLMDAMPVRMSQSLLCWADQLEQNVAKLVEQLPQLQALAQGGTAVGTGINAHPKFGSRFCDELNLETGLKFHPAGNLFSRISTQDTAVSLSGQLKATAVSMMKISNDLRWMNSGPLAGLGEIELEALQPGSSIMPGKVNPVIPESVCMVAAQVIGNDATITIAGQSGNFELNVMLPVVADNLLQSIELLTKACLLLADKAIAGFKVNEDKLNQSLSRNPILVTALNPVIGYLKAAEIAKKAYAENRPVIDVAVQETQLSREELLVLLDPAKLTRGGL